MSEGLIEESSLAGFEAAEELAGKLMLDGFSYKEATVVAGPAILLYAHIHRCPRCSVEERCDMAKALDLALLRNLYRYTPGNVPPVSGEFKRGKAKVRGKKRYKS